MVGPVRGLTIIESNSSNQDWVTAGGNPDTINIPTYFTRYVDYIDLDLLDFKDAPNVEIKVTSTVRGRAFTSKFGKWNPLYSFKALGISNEDTDKLKGFLYIHSLPGAPTLYCITFNRDADGYRLFWDPITETYKKYLRGELLDIQNQYAADNPVDLISGVFNGVWRV